jgi:hypothetical protein
VLERADNIDLTLETLPADRGGDLWSQNLYGDQLVAIGVAGEENVRSSTFAYLALEYVTTW